MYINENNYADEAEKVILQLKNKTNPKTGKSVPMVTTSKIRSILAMTSDIYNEVIMQQDDKLGDDLAGRIEYLRIRVVYEVGRDEDRDKPVKSFVMQSKILEILKEIKGSRKNYILFNRYMESLVAFHKFYGGRIIRWLICMQRFR